MATRCMSIATATGTLTGPDKRVAAKADARNGTAPLFEAGDIQVGGRTHKNLRLGMRDLNGFVERFDVIKQHLAKHPDARGISLSLDIETPGRTGQGLGGRVEGYVLGWDKQGVLAFSATPKEAPIIHFGGPLQICLFEDEKMTVGRETDMYLGLGTPGAGPGTTSFVAYERLVPNGVRPHAEITYSERTPGEPGQKQSIDFKQRCCTYNFWDPVRVPESAGPGKARINLSFDEWKEGHIHSSTALVEVVGPKPGPKLEPVSEGIKGALMHPNKAGVVHNIRFSPDGKRLIAGDYPGGFVVLWDVATGRALTQIETGFGYRPSADYYFLSPDWRTLYLPRTTKRERTRVQKGDKQTAVWECAGDVRTWDLQSGAQTGSFEHTPSRGVSWMALAPDGTSFVTFEHLSGESDKGPKLAASLWNVADKQARPLPGNLSPVPIFSPDSKTLLRFRRWTKRTAA